MYFDLETTAPTDNIFDPEQKKMFVVSDLLIIAFHSALNLNRIIIQRRYAHSLKELTTLNYLTKDQMKFIDLQILNQLKDITADVSKSFVLKLLLYKKHYLLGLTKKLSHKI